MFEIDFYDLNLLWLGGLFLVAVVAGIIDTIAGGGGLLVLPSLLLAGIPPNLAIATNKLQSWAGTGMASLYFIRRGIIDVKQSWLMISTTCIGSLLGAWLLFQIDLGILWVVVPFLLIGMAIFTLFQPNMGDITRKAKLSLMGYSLFLPLLIGFYDGFFGPGTGSFFALSFVFLMGFTLIKATAYAKLLNFTSNISAFAYFAFFEEFVLGVGLIMIVGQVIGASIGARLVVTKGNKIVRPLLVIISSLAATKMLIEA